MDKIVCKFCGTEYPSDTAKCPLCGASNAPHVADDFSFLDMDEENFETSAKPAGDEDVKVFDSEVKSQPAAMPVYEKREEPAAPAPAPGAKKQKKKNSGAVLTIVLLILVIGLLAALFFAARATGLLDGLFGKQEEEQEQQDDLQLPVEDVSTDCTGITLDLAEVALNELGATQQLTVTVEPEGCTDKVNWISSFPEIATVDGAGLITAVSEGSVNILVTCGDYAASCMVTVDLTPEEDTEAPEEGVAEPEEEELPEELEEKDAPAELNYADVTLFNPGETLQLKVEHLPEGETVTWSTSDDIVVSVDETGLVTATATGLCKVYAEFGETKLECIVRCNLGTPEGVKITASLSATDITMGYEGEQTRLSVSYANEEDAPEDPQYTWTTSDESICTVDEKGTITAVGRGQATVSVDVDGIVLKCTVRVNIPETEETETTEEG